MIFRKKFYEKENIFVPENIFDDSAFDLSQW
jgi:hypothetical protein